MKLEINVTKNRSGQSDRHSQICDCQNSINDKFVPDNVRDWMLISRLGNKLEVVTFVLSKICARNKSAIMQHPNCKGPIKTSVVGFINGKNFVNNS